MATKGEALSAAVGPGPPTLRRAFEEHYEGLIRLSFALCGELELAEDIVQDAFARSAQRLGQLNPAAVRAYLARCVVNGWKSRLRRMAVERRHAPRLETRGVIDESDTADRWMLWSAIQRLPNRQRACIVLRYYEDLPNRRVAEILRCSEGAVKKHLVRALGRLREEVTG